MTIRSILSFILVQISIVQIKSNCELNESIIPATLNE
jgi:hypothetical protein